MTLTPEEWGKRAAELVASLTRAERIALVALYGESMTAKQLIKALEKVVAQHGNVHVVVDLDTFTRVAADVYTMPNVQDVEVQSIRQVDGDGFTIENRDGTERTRRCAVLS